MPSDDIAYIENTVDALLNIWLNIFFTKMKPALGRTCGSCLDEMYLKLLEGALCSPVG